MASALSEGLSAETIATPLYPPLITIDILPVLHKSLVRLVTEYGNLVWGPFFNQDISVVESVQRRATKIVSSLAALCRETKTTIFAS